MMRPLRIHDRARICAEEGHPEGETTLVVQVKTGNHWEEVGAFMVMEDAEAEAKIFLKTLVAVVTTAGEGEEEERCAHRCRVRGFGMKPVVTDLCDSLGRLFTTKAAPDAPKRYLWQNVESSALWALLADAEARFRVLQPIPEEPQGLTRLPHIPVDHRMPPVKPPREDQEVVGPLEQLVLDTACSDRAGPVPDDIVNAVALLARFVDELGAELGDLLDGHGGLGVRDVLESLVGAFENAKARVGR